MQSKYIRTIGIVLAVILSMAADFLHRWVGQPIQPQLSEVACRGRDHWQSHNGRDLFFAGVLLAERHDGKRSESVALVAVIGSGVYLFIHFQDRFGNGDYDPRNFSRSKRGTLWHQRGG